MANCSPLLQDYELQESYNKFSNGLPWFDALEFDGLYFCMDNFQLDFPYWLKLPNIYVQASSPFYLSQDLIDGAEICTIDSFGFERTPSSNAAYSLSSITDFNRTLNQWGERCSFCKMLISFDTLAWKFNAKGELSAIPVSELYALRDKMVLERDYVVGHSLLRSPYWIDCQERITISFDDDQILANKCQTIRRRDLAGVSVGDLQFDASRGTIWSVWTTVQML